MRGGRFRRAKAIALGLTGGALAAVAGLAAFVYSGFYDISATDQHTPPVYWLMRFTMQRSVAVRARESETPELSGADTIEKGLRLYHLRCVQCHGAPGVAPDGAALGMAPVPGYLAPTAREWSAAQIHWVVKNGIKMTGMPAWKYRMSEEEMWQVTAFVKQRLPYVTPDQYREMSAKLTGTASAETTRAEGALTGGVGDPDAGRRAIDQYSCATCHVIPGITGATQHVGPPLTGMASRSYIAGVLANTPENMVRWIMWPQRASPAGAMPDLGVREEDARDIAAYLATLKAD